MWRSIIIINGRDNWGLGHLACGKIIIRGHAYSRNREMIWFFGSPLKKKLLFTRSLDKIYFLYERTSVFYRLLVQFFIINCGLIYDVLTRYTIDSFVKSRGLRRYWKSLQAKKGSTSNVWHQILNSIRKLSKSWNRETRKLTLGFPLFFLRFLPLFPFLFWMPWLPYS